MIILLLLLDHFSDVSYSMWILLVFKVYYISQPCSIDLKPSPLPLGLTQFETASSTKYSQN